MDVSRQTANILAGAVVMAAVVPGAAGYLTGRLEAIEAAKRDLRAMRVEMRTPAAALAVPLCEMPWDRRGEREHPPGEGPLRAGGEPAPPEDGPVRASALGHPRG